MFIVGPARMAQPATYATGAPFLAGFTVPNGTKTRFVVATWVCMNGQINFVFPLAHTGVEKTIDHGGVGGTQTSRWVDAFGEIASDCGCFTPATAFVATADSPPPPQSFHVGPSDVVPATKRTVRACEAKEEVNKPGAKDTSKDTPKRATSKKDTSKNKDL
jgi:hypothetical protein